MLSQFLGSRASTHVAVTLKEKCIYNKCHLLFSSFRLAFIAECDFQVEYAFGQLWSVVLALSYPNFLSTPSLLAFGEESLERQPCCCVSTAQQYPKQLSTPFYYKAQLYIGFYSVVVQLPLGHLAIPALCSCFR